MRSGKTRPHLSTAPFSIVGIDAVGPFEENTNGNVYLITMVDMFLRWPIAIPVRNLKAETVARAIYKGLIRDHG